MNHPQGLPRALLVRLSAQLWQVGAVCVPASSRTPRGRTTGGGDRGEV